MLWYKAWLETRVRFLICLAGITLFCADNVLRMEYGHGSQINLAYDYSVINTSDIYLVVWWILAVTLLTMGGLLRERAMGAISLTLALPASRARLVGVRAAMTLIEAVALMVIPWAAIFATSSLMGKTPSIPQALFHLVMMAGGGSVLYALGFLVSSLVEGEYTAPIVSFGLILMILFNLLVDRRYNPLVFMMGAEHFDSRSGLLTGSIPWIQVAGYAVVAAGLILASIKALQLREF